MKVSLLLLKQWCEQHLSPMAWQRIALHAYGHLKNKGYSLKDLQAPAAEAAVEGEELTIICEAIHELYQEEVPLSDLA